MIYAMVTLTLVAAVYSEVCEYVCLQGVRLSACAMS